MGSCITADIVLLSILLVECIGYILLFIPGDPTFHKTREWCISICQDSSKIHSDKAINPHHYREGVIMKSIGTKWWLFVKYRNLYVLVLIAIDKLYINYGRQTFTDEPNYTIASLIWLLPLTIIIIASQLTFIIPPIIVASLSAQITYAMDITTQFISFSVSLLVGGIVAYSLKEFVNSTICDSAMVYSSVAILSSFIVYQLHDYSTTKEAPNSLIICDIYVKSDMVSQHEINPLMILICFTVIITIMMLKTIILASFTMCNYNTCACQQCWCKCLDRCAIVKSTDYQQQQSLSPIITVTPRERVF